MAYTTIDDSEAYFQVQLYTGNGAANNAIALDGDTAMQPDMVWIKNRDQGDHHCQFDSIRGATKHIGGWTSSPYTAYAEVTDGDTLDSFTSTGFQVDADVKVNTNTEKYVALCWKAGTAASGTTGGEGTGKAYSTTYNDTSKLQITGYAGNGTAGHTIPVSLSTAPKTVWCKRRDAAGDFHMFHHGLTSAPETEYQTHNLAVAADDVGAWNDTLPSSSVVTLGDLATLNTDDATNIMWAWDEVQGFSKFGSFTGNGNNDGPFIYCGFRPALIISRKYDTSAGTTNFWTDEQNQNQNVMDVLQTFKWYDAEGTAATYAIDMLSNGFKFRGYRADTNTNGVKHIFWAFAKSPFVNSKGVPGTAL